MFTARGFESYMKKMLVDNKLSSHRTFLLKELANFVYVSRQPFGGTAKMLKDQDEAILRIIEVFKYAISQEEAAENRDSCYRSPLRGGLDKLEFDSMARKWDRLELGNFIQ